MSEKMGVINRGDSATVLAASHRMREYRVSVNPTWRSLRFASRCCHMPLLKHQKRCRVSEGNRAGIRTLQRWTRKLRRRRQQRCRRRVRVLPIASLQFRIPRRKLTVVVCRLRALQRARTAGVRWQPRGHLDASRAPQALAWREEVASEYCLLNVCWSLRLPGHLLACLRDCLLACLFAFGSVCLFDCTFLCVAFVCVSVSP